MKRKIIFRGQVVEVVENRVPEEKRISYQHYYNLVSNDRDFTRPFYISETERMVNWFGYIVSREPLDTSKASWFKLKPHERDFLASWCLEDQVTEILMPLQERNFTKLEEVVKDRCLDFSDIDDCYKIGKNACYRKGFGEDLDQAYKFLKEIKNLKKVLF